MIHKGLLYSEGAFHRALVSLHHTLVYGASGSSHFHILDLHTEELGFSEDDEDHHTAPPLGTWKVVVSEDVPHTLPLPHMAHGGEVAEDGHCTQTPQIHTLRAEVSEGKHHILPLHTLKAVAVEDEHYTLPLLDILKGVVSEGGLHIHILLMRREVFEDGHCTQIPQIHTWWAEVSEDGHRTLLLHI